MKKLLLLIVVVLALFFSLDLFSIEETSVDDKMHSFEDNVSEQSGYHETYTNSNLLGNIALSIDNLITKVFNVFRSLLDEIFSEL